MSIITRINVNRVANGYVVSTDSSLFVFTSPFATASHVARLLTPEVETEAEAEAAAALEPEPELEPDLVWIAAEAVVNASNTPIPVSARDNDAYYEIEYDLIKNLKTALSRSRAK